MKNCIGCSKVLYEHWTFCPRCGLNQNETTQHSKGSVKLD